MKLYTEEQVKDAFIKGILKGMAGSTLSTYELFEMYISEVTPIELPNDDDMANASNHCKDGQVKVGFLRGVLWYQEQILNQNK